VPNLDRDRALAGQGGVARGEAVCGVLVRIQTLVPPCPATFRERGSRASGLGAVCQTSGGLIIAHRATETRQRPRLAGLFACWPVRQYVDICLRLGCAEELGEAQSAGLGKRCG